MAVFAEVIEDWKTDYAQAEVDGRRARKRLTVAFSPEGFDAEAATAALQDRTQSLARVHSGVVEGLSALHDALSPEQRSTFALLVRTGEIKL